MRDYLKSFVFVATGIEYEEYARIMNELWPAMIDGWSDQEIADLIKKSFEITESKEINNE